jgi:RNA polymerase sigma-54 factor
MALSQGLYQKLQQKLSPQQIQLMKLLQVPTAQLEERIKEELEDNPALELDPESESTSPEDETAPEESIDEGDTEVDAYDEYEVDDDGDYKTREDAVPELQGSGVIPHPSSASLHDSLIEQLGLLQLEPAEVLIAEQVIGSIDDDGYLRRETMSIVDDLAFKQNVVVESEQVEAVIEKIQLFDPPGIAARNVQECLVLQLRRKVF